MKTLNRDLYGYINNRGRSKYWGVSVTADGDWMLSYHPVDSTFTHSAAPNNFKITELDVANIAAKIYEYGSIRKFTESSLRVLSLDKRYVFWIRGNTIFREPYKAQTVTEDKPNNDLFSGSKVEKPVMRIRRVDHTAKNSAPKEKVQDESDIVASITKTVLESNLSETSVKVLIAVMQSTLKTK